MDRNMQFYYAHYFTTYLIYSYHIYGTSYIRLASFSYWCDIRWVKM